MTRIQLRRGNAAAWSAANPVLAAGEVGVELDTGKYKIGDGSTTWNALAYAKASWSTIEGKPAVIAAGATQADARTAIGAGTSSLVLGSTSSTAKPGDYTPSSSEITTALGFTPQNAAQKGQPSGIASLDSAGKLPASQLPTTALEYLGVWNASTNTPTLADGSGNAGDMYRVSVGGSRNLGSGSVTYDVGDLVLYDGSVWQRSDSTDAVSSVNGYTGSVTLTKSDVGLSNADNTADAAKNVLSASKLSTARTINGVSFDGTGNITVADSTKMPTISATTVKTSAYSAAVNELVPADATGGAFTVTLPAAPAQASRIIVKKIDSSANAVTVACSGSDKFNTTSGSSTRLLQIQSEAITVQYNSTLGVWYVVATDSPITQLDSRYLRSSAGTTFSSSSASETVLPVSATIAQSGTAGYTGVLINATETSTGSGTKRLIDAQVGGSSRFSVDNAGNINAASLRDVNGVRSVFVSNSIPFLGFTTGSGSTGNHVQFYSNFTGSSGVAVQAGLSPTINQSSTAGYTCLLINPTETSTGSGVKRLIDAQLGGSSRLTVDTAGVLNAAGGVQVNGVDVLTTTGTQTVSGKTISGGNNTLSNIAQSSVTSLTTDLAAKEATANKGQPSGYCPLDSSGLVSATYLPSYVDDVIEYANLAAFPATNTTGRIYVALDTGKIYRWSGSAYIEISPSPGSTDSVTEGSVNLYFTNARAQSALTTQLAGKEPTITAGTAGQYWSGTKTWATLDKAAVGLGSADNTSDASKPISTATQSALDGKQATMTATTVKTSGYTAAVNELVPVDATGGAFTVTLPSAPANAARIIVKKIDSSANAVTIACSGSDKFNTTSGSSTRLLQIQSEAITAQYNSTLGVWYVVATDTPVTQLKTYLDTAASAYTNKTYTDIVYAITDGAAFELNPANGGIQTLTLGASRTPKATNFLSGQSVTLQVAATSSTITWTDATLNPTWIGGVAPTLSSTQTTVIVLWKVGSTVYGSLVGYA